MGALLLIVVTCLVLPPAALVAFTLAGGLAATVGLFLLGFAGAVATAVAIFLLPVALARVKPQLPRDLH